MLLRNFKRRKRILHSTVYFAFFLSVVMSWGISYGIESDPAIFLKKVFQDGVPEPEYIWITPTIRPILEEILTHDYKGLRIKYWRKNERAVWILEELAKDTTVCAGVVVIQGKIHELEILSAEGRYGSLVKNEKFTAQFKNVGGDGNKRLTRSIDGISGATISVNTVSRLARLALALDEIQETVSN